MRIRRQVGVRESLGESFFLSLPDAVTFGAVAFVILSLNAGERVGARTKALLELCERGFQM